MAKFYWSYVKFIVLLFTYCGEGKSKDWFLVERSFVELSSTQYKFIHTFWSLYALLTAIEFPFLFHFLVGTEILKTIINFNLRNLFCQFASFFFFFFFWLFDCNFLFGLNLNGDWRKLIDWFLDLISIGKTNIFNSVWFNYYCEYHCSNY